MAGEPGRAPVAVAICKDQASGGYFLFRCDAEWRTTTDTWHETLEQACAQAESEFANLSSTWVAWPPHPA